MDSYVKWMDGHSRLIKIILCIWILDITWAVYRIGRAASKQTSSGSKKTNKIRIGLRAFSFC